MKNYLQILFASAAVMLLSSCRTVEEPSPLMPVPTRSQVEWQQQETYAFIHFGLNTYTNQEWGYGNVSPEVFNPEQLDCDQWVRILKQAGMTNIILTAKHHDGFCLWPTEYTDYSVVQAPWRNGKGDVVGELAQACQRAGVAFSFYLSPWDRHQAFYGQPEYLTYYHNQLQELLTRYGKVREVWLDGANGGDGWYGGADCKRKIDARTYYDYPAIHQHIYSLQPDAIIFSDGGPGCRWVGNEKGIAGETNWSLLRGNDVYPGYPYEDELNVGHTDGTHWIPAECDVSIRPGWFWHADEDKQVKTPEQLFDLYCKSVGRNGNFLLNVPVNSDGLISEQDSLSLMGFRSLLDKAFARNILRGASAKADRQRGRAWSAGKTIDGKYDTYWATADGELGGSLCFTFPRQQMQYVVLQEYIPKGQRVKAFHVEYKGDADWMPLPIDEQTTTIGYKRILRFAPVMAQGLRIVIDDARECPCISSIEAY